MLQGRAVVQGFPNARVGQAFPVVVRTGYVVPGNDWLRLIAVAPGKGWYDVVGKVTGTLAVESSH